LVLFTPLAIGPGRRMRPRHVVGTYGERHRAANEETVEPDNN